MKETWKDVIGYEGLYKISNKGRVYSISRNKILKPYLAKSGRFSINLSKLDIGKGFLVFRLVAQAFIPNPNNLETVNHKDEIKINNNVKNLEWMSNLDNIRYSIKRSGKGIGDRSPHHILTSNQVREIRKLKKFNPDISYEKVARIFNVKYDTIYDICANRSWINIP